MSWKKIITEYKKAYEENQDLQTNFKPKQSIEQEKSIKKITRIQCINCGIITYKISKYSDREIFILICDCGIKLVWNYELTRYAKIITQVS